MKCLLTECGFRKSWIVQELHSIVQKFETGGVDLLVNALGADDGVWSTRYPTKPGWYPVTSALFPEIVHLQWVAVDVETGMLAPFNIDANDDWKRREWDIWKWWYSKPVKLPPPPRKER